jgi:hypothetical protein
MPSITFDGQSFIIDGKRLWLVGGTVHYARLNRDQWADRIRLAKLAGLNTITTSVVWARHEPRPGTFDFSGDNDLRHFVQLVHQAGLHCVLRLGPYVGEGFDFGGLPPWVLTLKEVQLRTTSASFLEACSRFFGAVARQVRDLQVTVPQSPGDTHGGPVVLVQSEHQWTCGSEARAASYLGELHRYIRESGFDVPISNANNLWQGAEGEVDTWVGSEELLAFVRQLATVRPQQPRVVSEFSPGGLGAWGEAEPEALSAAGLTRRLAQVLAGAGQFNIEPFAGGTNFAFAGGRLAGGQGRWATTDASNGAMVDAAGRRTELFEPARRVSLFASRFARLLSHLDPKAYAVGLHPETGGGLSVMHASGSQGSVVFVFNAGATEADRGGTATGKRRGAAAGAGAGALSLLLSNGTTLSVYPGDAPVSWYLLETRLHGRSHLDSCNLTPLAMVGRVLVLHGPAGTPGRVSINGSVVDVEVPGGPGAGKAAGKGPAKGAGKGNAGDGGPVIFEHESVVLVVCASEQLSRVQVTDDAVLVNAVDVGPLGEPVVSGAGDVVTRVLASGHVVKSKVGDRQTVPGVPAPVVKAEPLPVKKGGKGVAKPAKAAGAKGVKKGTVEPPAVVEVEPAPELAGVVVASKGWSGKPIELGAWSGADLREYVEGTSARYASISGPAELGGLGAPYGYGWYRLTLRSRSAGKAVVAWPQSGDRLHLFVEGKACGVIGGGPGASRTTALGLRKKEQELVVLAENLGRFAGGAHMTDLKGCFGHLWEVAPSRGVSRAQLNREAQLPVLASAGFVPGLHDGDVTDAMRVTWEISKRRGPVLMTMGGVGQLRGLIVVNGTPLRYFDATGPGCLLLDDAQLGKGSAVVQLAVVGDGAGALRALGEGVGFEDAVACVSAEAQWAFAKWEKPGEGMYHPLRGHSHGKGPEWFKSSFTLPAGFNGALHLSTGELSKGQVYVNGRHVGRYFSRTHDGKDVGPAHSLFIPAAALKLGEANEVLVFDEHGHLPGRSRLVVR